MATLSVRFQALSANTCMFVESAPGVFSNRFDYGGSAQTVSVEHTPLVAVAVPLIKSRYIPYFSPSPTGSTETNWGYVEYTQSYTGSAIKPIISSSDTTLGASITIIDAHGTHYGTPTGVGVYGNGATIAVQHNSTEAGWVFSGWKVTKADTYDRSGIVLSTGGTTVGTETTFSNGFTNAVVVKTEYSEYPLTIEAIYVEPSTLTYNPDGGSPTPSPAQALAGTEITLASAISKAENNFLGWEIGGVLYAGGAVYTLNESVTATAIWTVLSVYTTTFSTEESGVTGTGPSQLLCEAGYRIRLPGQGGWSKSGYWLLGWSTTSTGAVSYYEGDLFFPVGNSTLYGIWASGDGDNIACARYYRNYTGSSLPIVRTTITSAQYRFFLYSDFPGGVVVNFQTRNLSRIRHRIRLYYKGSLTSDTGTVLDRNQSALLWYNLTINLTNQDFFIPQPQTGVTFINYYRYKNYITTDSDHTAVREDWEDTNVADTDQWNVVVPAGYDLLGWFSFPKANMTGETLEFSKFTRKIATSSTITFADIRKCSYYKTVDTGNYSTAIQERDYNNYLFIKFIGKKVPVTFNPTVGSLAIVDQAYREVRFNEQYGTLPLVAAMAGYTFLGWFTEAEGGTEVVATTTVTNYNAHMLYAHWSGGPVQPGDETYVVSYVDQTGTNPPYVTTRTRGISITMPDVPTGFGWVTPTGYSIDPVKTYSAYDSAGVATFYANAQSGVGDFPCSEDLDYVTVRVLFIPIVQTVTFNGNGGTVSTSTVDYFYGQNYGNFPVNATLQGKRFLGWFTEAVDGVEVTGSSPVTTDSARTLYAHWEEAVRIPWTMCIFS